MNRHLHIVCLDVPWPADYGGAIDMMNRIMALKKRGILIHLHYYSYNDRGTPNELNQFCESIAVYQRKKGYKGFSLSLPYIVASRINDSLIENLNKNDYPIIVEGLHCTGILPFINNKKRKIVVRMHNEESLYYKELARAEKSWLKKIYFLIESKLIKKYNRQLPNYCTYACVSKKDIDVLKNTTDLSKLVLIPTFPAWQKVKGEEGIGNFCLYQANLSVPENEEAAIWLITKVFSKLNKPLVIAGKNPSEKLQKLSHSKEHICMVVNPTETEMDDLVRKAHINLLPLFNTRITGIRLKLLHALLHGRHCIASEAIVKGTGLESACHIAATSDAFASIILQLSNMPFAEEEKQLRKKLFADTYSNEKNAEVFSQYLW